MTGSEVVHRDVDAEVVQLGKDASRVRHVLHRNARRDLELEEGRSESRLLDDAAHRDGEIPLVKLARRYVHGHAEARSAARVPRHELLAGAAEDPLAEDVGLITRLGEWDELAG